MARTPVIFIPGLTGSFNLTVLLDWRGPTLGGWGFPPFIDYGKGFLDAFQRAGYTRDKDLFVAFYDWRKSVVDSAANYLRPWIDRARRASGAQKVILVGHSMGGLVARSYIQGRDYRGDVERLITLGTPHRGSAEAYYTWGSGETRADPTVQAVFNVYLWYLRHAHPFQTELDPLRTIRTQVPGIRDLLPIDPYLLGQGPPPALREEDLHLERNLVGDMLNLPAALETLFSRVPVTTISGVGFRTIRAITVGDPPLPPGDPARFPDGSPVADQVEGEGDGTVLRASAQLEHGGATNLAPLSAGHGALPDHPAVLTRIFGELGVTSPALGAAPEPQPTRLVIMTASPVTLEVRTPAGQPMAPPGALGSAEAEGPPRRPRRLRGRDHGHSGKHLNIAVVDSPPAGSYDVRLRGTATGSFALGALIVSAEGVVVLGGGEDEAPQSQPTETPITTVRGQVAAGSELHYRVICGGADQPPEIRLDVAATARSALDRLRGAMADMGGEVLGGGAAVDEQEGRLMAGGEATAAAAREVAGLVEQLVGPQDDQLALALITQLRALG